MSIRWEEIDVTDALSDTFVGDPRGEIQFERAVWEFVGRGDYDKAFEYLEGIGYVDLRTQGFSRVKITEEPDDFHGTLRRYFIGKERSSRRRR